MGRHNGSAWGAVSSIIMIAVMASLAPCTVLADVENPYASALNMPQGLVKQVTVTGDSRGIGVFTQPLAGFPRTGDSFVIMSTGVAADAYLPDRNNRERLGIGYPLDDTSTSLVGMTARGTWDLEQLQVTLTVPGWAKGFAFDFAFFTEEWPDYYGSPFNDGFLVETGESDFTVQSDGQIVAPRNIVYDSNGNLISVSVGFGLDPAQPNPDTGTTYDGTTGLLTTVSPIPPDTKNLTLIFSMFDVNDGALDSAVFLDNFRFLADPVDKPHTGPQNSPPPSFPESSVGKITAGGTIGADGTRGRFSTQLITHDGTTRGTCEYESVITGQLLLGSTITSTRFYQDPGGGPGMPLAPYNTAVIEGEGVLEGEGDVTFTAWLTDRGEPGTDDQYRIQIVKDGRVLVDEGGTLLAGNIQIHPITPTQ